MKAEELRLGNLLIRPTINPENASETLELIMPVTHVDIRDAVHYGKDWNAEPIPLTEDFLKKVDWKGYKYLHINSNFSLDESGHLYYRSDYTGINIDYVHTLQNLYYALTGSDLTLKE